MPGHDIIVVGTSAGGVEALTTIVGGLPRDLPAAVFVVMHFPAHSPSVLPAILARAGPLPASHAVDGERIRQGHIYVAPPNLHLLVDREYVRVVHGPRENHHRPAVDVLFRTAARAHGPRVVGVVLTGALNDGTAGLLAVKRRGGVAVVQDPADAFFPGMPASALEYVDVDHCLRLPEIAPTLARVAREPAGDERRYPVPPDMEIEARVAKGEIVELDDTRIVGAASGFTCPECQGPLWEIHDGALVRFRCRTGHAFTGDSLLAEKSEQLEDALWVALNTLEESALMAERLAAEARERNHSHVAERFQERAAATNERAEVLRRVLLSMPNIPVDSASAALEDAPTKREA